MMPAMRGAILSAACGLLTAAGCVVVLGIDDYYVLDSASVGG